MEIPQVDLETPDFALAAPQIAAIGRTIRLIHQGATGIVSVGY
jgi:hypothetical protein